MNKYSNTYHKTDGILNKYSNTYHKTIKMKLFDLNASMYIVFNKEKNKEGPKFKVGNHVRISKFKSIFAKGSVPVWSEEAFVIKKVKNTVLWTDVISDLNGEQIVLTFYEKEL